MRQTWTEGWLPDGTHFHVDADPYAHGGVLRIDGAVVEPIPGPLGVSRRRDGGTTEIRTDRGRLYCYRALGREHYDAWEGEQLLRRPPTIMALLRSQIFKSR